jgi:hypothetical protein
MGGLLPGRGNIVISAHIGGAMGYTAGLVVDGVTIPPDQIVPNADAMVTFRVPRTKVKRRLLVTIGNGHRPLLIGNPIYVLQS